MRSSRVRNTFGGLNCKKQETKVQRAKARKIMLSSSGSLVVDSAIRIANAIIDTLDDRIARRNWVQHFRVCIKRECKSGDTLRVLKRQNAPLWIKIADYLRT